MAVTGLPPGVARVGVDVEELLDLDLLGRAAGKLVDDDVLPRWRPAGTTDCGLVSPAGADERQKRLTTQPVPFDWWWWGVAVPGLPMDVRSDGGGG